MPNRRDEEQREIEASIQDFKKKPEQKKPLTGPEQVAQQMGDDDFPDLTQAARQATRQGTPAAPSDPDSAWNELEQFVSDEPLSASGSNPHTGWGDLTLDTANPPSGVAKDITGKEQAAAEKEERFNKRMKDYVAWKVWRPPFEHFTPEVATGMGNVAGLRGVSEGIDDALDNLFGDNELADPTELSSEREDEVASVEPKPSPTSKPSKTNAAEENAIKAEMQQQGATPAEIAAALAQSRLFDHVDSRGLNASRVAEYLGSDRAIAKEYRSFIRFDASKENGQPELLLHPGDIIVAVNGRSTTAYDQTSYTGSEDERDAKREALAGAKDVGLADFKSGMARPEVLTKLNQISALPPERLDAMVPWESAGDVLTRYAQAGPEGMTPEELKAVRTTMGRFGVNFDPVEDATNLMPLVASYVENPEKVAQGKHDWQVRQLESRLLDKVMPPPDPIELIKEQESSALATSLKQSGMTDEEIDSFINRGNMLSGAVERMFNGDSEAIASAYGFPADMTLDELQQENPKLATKISRDLLERLKASALAKALDIGFEQVVEMLHQQRHGNPELLRSAILKWQKNTLNKSISQSKLDAKRSATKAKGDEAAAKLAAREKQRREIAKAMGQSADIVKDVPAADDNFKFEDVDITTNDLPLLEADDDFEMVGKPVDKPTPGLFTGRRVDPGFVKQAQVLGQKPEDFADYVLSHGDEFDTDMVQKAKDAKAALASQQQITLDPRHRAGGRVEGEPNSIRIGKKGTPINVPGARDDVKITKKQRTHNRVGLAMIRDMTAGSYSPDMGALEEPTGDFAPIVTIIRAPTSNPDILKQLSGLGYPVSAAMDPIPYIEVAKAQYIGHAGGQYGVDKLDDDEKTKLNLWFQKLQAAQDMYFMARDAYVDSGLISRREFPVLRMRANPKAGEGIYWKKPVNLPADFYGRKSSEKLANLQIGDLKGIDAANAMLVKAETMLREVATDAIEHYDEFIRSTVPQDADATISPSAISQVKRAADMITRIAAVMGGDMDMMYHDDRRKNREHTMDQTKKHDRLVKKFSDKAFKQDVAVDKSALMAAIRELQAEDPGLPVDEDSFRFSALAGMLSGRALAHSGLSVSQFEKSYHAQHPGDKSLKGVQAQLDMTGRQGVSAGLPQVDKYHGSGRTTQGRWKSDSAGRSTWNPSPGVPESVQARAAIVESLRERVEATSGAKAASKFIRLASADPRKIAKNLTEGVVLLCGFTGSESVLNGLSAKILEHSNDGFIVEIMDTPRARIIHEDDRKIFVDYNEVIVIDGKLVKNPIEDLAKGI